MRGDELKYPSGEVVWVRYFDSGGNLRFLMTTKTGRRDTYFLYESAGDGFKKLGRASTPTDLEEKLDVDSKLQKG